MRADRPSSRRVDASHAGASPSSEISLDIVTEREPVVLITVDIWLLSVTESFGLPPQYVRHPEIQSA
jgi:hypothetical protein